MKKFKIRILAAVVEDNDKDAENAQPTVLEIPIKAKNVETAKKRVATAIERLIPPPEPDMDELMKQLKAVGMAAQRQSRSRGRQLGPGTHRIYEQKAPLPPMAPGEPSKRTKEEEENIIRKMMKYFGEI